MAVREGGTGCQHVPPGLQSFEGLEGTVWSWVFHWQLADIIPVIDDVDTKSSYSYYYYSKYHTHTLNIEIFFTCTV